jgi:hypothetical protein
MKALPILAQPAGGEHIMHTGQFGQDGGQHLMAVGNDPASARPAAGWGKSSAEPPG